MRICVWLIGMLLLAGCPADYSGGTNTNSTRSAAKLLEDPPRETNISGWGDLILASEGVQASEQSAERFSHHEGVTYNKEESPDLKSIREQYRIKTEVSDHPFYLDVVCEEVKGHKVITVIVLSSKTGDRHGFASGDAAVRMYSFFLRNLQKKYDPNLVKLSEEIQGSTVDELMHWLDSSGYDGALLWQTSLEDANGDQILLNLSFGIDNKPSVTLMYISPLFDLTRGDVFEKL